MNSVEWLEEWYRQHCNGSWEHSFGVRIDTLDNPGWILEIDLVGTKLAGRVLERVVRAKSDTYWIQYSSDGATFRAVGDPMRLGQLIDAFRRWSERNENPERMGTA